MPAAKTPGTRGVIGLAIVLTALLSGGWLQQEGLSSESEQTVSHIRPEIGVDELIFDCRVPSVAARIEYGRVGDDPRYAYIHACAAGVSEIERFYMSTHR